MSDSKGLQSDLQTPSWLASELARAQPALFSYACTMLGGTHDAWDLLQNANQIILEKAFEVHGVEGFMPWALTIIRYQAMALRTKVARDRHVFNLVVLEKMSRHADAQSVDFPDRVTALEECLNLLPERQRECLALRYNRNLPVRDIAQQIRRPERAVTNVLYRARLALAECITRKLSKGSGL